MFRFSLFLKTADGVFLVDEIWSTDEDALITEGRARLVQNDQYLGIVTTYEPVSAVTL